MNTESNGKIAHDLAILELKRLISKNLFTPYEFDNSKKEHLCERYFYLYNYYIKEIEDYKAKQCQYDESN